jgi:hypothetical protein
MLRAAVALTWLGANRPEEQRQELRPNDALALDE